MSDERNRGCPLCGNPVSEEDFADIEERMEHGAATCCGCGMCFWEVREELEYDEGSAE